MLLLYEYSNQNITEFQAFCNNSLSQAEKEKIFIPTYDCMKKYQGTWHIEPRPVFQDCMLIECENKENLIQTLNQNQCPTDIVQSIAAQTIHLHPEQQKIPAGSHGPEPPHPDVNRLHQRRFHPRHRGSLTGKRKPDLQD